MSTSQLYRRYPMIVPHPLTHGAVGRMLFLHLTNGGERNNTVDCVGGFPGAFSPYSPDGGCTVQQLPYCSKEWNVG